MSINWHYHLPSTPPPVTGKWPKLCYSHPIPDLPSHPKSPEPETRWIINWVKFWQQLNLIQRLCVTWNNPSWEKFRPGIRRTMDTLTLGLRASLGSIQLYFNYFYLSFHLLSDFCAMRNPGKWENMLLCGLSIQVAADGSEGWRMLVLRNFLIAWFNWRDSERSSDSLFGHLNLISI